MRVLLPAQLNLGSAFPEYVNAALGYNLTPPFDPYFDDISFLIGAFIFEDVAVTWIQARSAWGVDLLLNLLR